MAQNPLLEEQLKAYWKTKEFIVDSVGVAGGWEQNIHQLSRTTGPQVFCYVYDLPTKWVWMCSVPRQSFVDVSEHAFHDKENIEVVRGSLAYVISGAADAYVTAPQADSTMESQLGTLLAAYAGTTKSWELLDRYKHGGHFIVLHYRHGVERNGLLRPFSVADLGKAPLPVVQLQELIAQVLSEDRSRHPDWFL